jgi:hypothetical protein
VTVVVVDGLEPVQIDEDQQALPGQQEVGEAPSGTPG